MKALHDSCYIPPVQNPRVIQDSDPIKLKAQAEAQARHDGKIATQKMTNERVVAEHFSRIQADEG